MPNLIGRTLGPYRILEQIGVGGMATVFKAYQLTMERDVALKILPHYLSEDATFAKRFEREAHAIARLEHAHILPVYDFGACDGITFIAMRYMPGGTLKDRLARGRLPLDEVTRLIGQIGGALDYAHRQGVIHRDVKPGNVLLDDQGEAYLTDFGLARMLESSQQLTASGVGVGTPAYMAPEQGQGLPADQRSDLYSLGVILFEMVTGRVPFEAETPMAVVLKHITEPLPLPRAVRPDVPEPVEKVILKALAKDPDHRYQSAEALTQALSAAARQAAASAPTVVAALPRPARPRFKFPSLKAHHALRAALFLTAGLVVVAAAATLWTQFSPAAAPARTAEPTARPTVLAATAAPPRPSPVVEAGGIPLRVHFASSSDWATVTILSGEALEAWRTLESGGDNVKAAAEARTLRLNQPSADAQAGRFVFMVQDGRLLGVSPQASIALRSEKGCWGTTTIEVFNLATGTPLLVERYIHANCERATYILPAARLLTADVPATPTALPGELPLIYPPSPETGRLVIGCGAEPFRQICVAVMQSGQLKPAEPITPELPVYGIASAPSWARFGSQMVFSASPTRTDPPHLYVMQADGSGLQQVMDGEAYDPVWSPDGAWIAFTRNRGLWLVRPDGEDAHEIVAATDLGVAGPAWSPDSRRLAYLLVGDGVFSQLRVVDAAGANPRLVTAFDRSDGFQHGSVVWSSDGRSLAVALWREGGEPAQVRVRDAEDGRETARLEGVPFWWYSNFWPQWGLPPAGGGAAPPG